MTLQLPVPTDIGSYLSRHETKPLLRFITCGSVDDGKSTLIGRLLYDTRALLDDQLVALEAESRRFGARDGEIDLALLVDGLAAEREQGITIDVAYRFFTTDRRKFIVADCPGHEQYTRNMATGASTAELAIVLIDARKGILAQTRRHSYIVSLLGIRHVVLAVNKMDLLPDGESVFEAICEAYADLAQQLGIDQVTCIPISALRGDNVIHRSEGMEWYTGPALLEHLESVEVEPAPENAGMTLPVQWVCRPDQNFRGFAGTLGSGILTPGMDVVVLPSGRRSRVKRVLVAEREVSIALAGQAVVVTLADEVDASRGDLIAGVDGAPEVADQFSVHLLWMGEQPLLPGRGYVLRIGSRTLNAQITEIKHRVDVNSQQLLAAKHLELNEVGQCNLYLDQPLPFRPYAENRGLGAFILIDRQSNETVAAGTLDFALRRSANIHWHASVVDKPARARASGHPARCVWLTGLSGSGKSSIASLAEQRLHAAGYRTYTLDGDNLRHGLNKDLGFTDEDRVENIRRAAEVARLMVDAGMVVLVSFISPFRAERRMARGLFEPEEFIEVFVDVPLSVAEKRDVKGLYAKARSGALPNFTGIDSAYEVPEHPELHLDTDRSSLEEAVDQLVARVMR